MNVNRLIALLAVLIILPTVSYSEDLGFIERSSLSEILADEGHKGITVVSGTKTPQEDPNDGPGWYISARAIKGSQDWIAKFWISSDWKKGRVISCKKRE